jgi:hypothetical protein
MTRKDAKNGAVKAGKNRAQVKKKVPRRPQDTVRDLAAREKDDVKGGVPKQPDRYET